MIITCTDLHLRNKYKDTPDVWSMKRFTENNDRMSLSTSRLRM